MRLVPYFFTEKEGITMAFGNYAPFYRPNYYPAQPMQPMQPMQAQGNFDSSMQYGQPFQQPMQAPQMPMQNQTNQQYSNDTIWVQGFEGAKAYLVAPNNSVTLWDSENPTIYVKSADASGVPSMRILDFTERTANAQKTPTEHVCKCGDNFVSKEAFKALEARFNELDAKIKSLSSNVITSNNTEVNENA